MMFDASEVLGLGCGSKAGVDDGKGDGQKDAPPRPCHMSDVMTGHCAEA